MHKAVSRTKCQIYTRVMGYFRPVDYFNIGKKSEFYSRRYFDSHKATISAFMGKYSSTTC